MGIDHEKEATEVCLYVTNNFWAELPSSKATFSLAVDGFFYFLFSIANIFSRLTFSQTERLVYLFVRTSGMFVE